MLAFRVRGFFRSWWLLGSSMVTCIVQSSGQHFKLLFQCFYFSLHHRVYRWTGALTRSDRGATFSRTEPAPILGRLVGILISQQTQCCNGRPFGVWAVRQRSSHWLPCNSIELSSVLPRLWSSKHTAHLQSLLEESDNKVRSSSELLCSKSQ